MINDIDLGEAQTQSIALPPIRTRPTTLSLRQRQVLELLLLGLPNKTICKRLNIEIGTTKVHVSAVLRAFDVRTRSELITEAHARGFHPPGAE